jgi:phosphatidate phosphatase APP1
MGKTSVILLSFYGLSNGTHNVFFGKLAHSPVTDLSFKKYSWFKNFKTIIGLYQSSGVANTAFEMCFDHGTVHGKTDRSGSFWCEVDFSEKQTRLESLRLLPTGEEVELTQDLYPNHIQPVDSPTIVISDLDDTLIHSFIGNKFKQFRTLLFTSVEKRKAVKSMQQLIKRFALSGTNCFYLSNSEQNLYPLLYRFLTINEFPPGPLFLKQFIHLAHVVGRRIRGRKHTHKMTMLAKIMELFPNKKYILIGDNTQKDLTIYLTLAEQFPERIRYIIIRKVRDRKAHDAVLAKAAKTLKENNIGLYYEKEFPEDIPWDL